MAKYLFEGHLTAESVRGTMQEGGTARREAITSLVEAHGGTVEAFYYAFGHTDVYGIVDMPDNATVAALALAISGSGVVSVSTTVLITPEEIDEAANIDVDYTPPGG
ncbi:MAG: GYD domain-containing protein [Nitriliruptorales bacterium]|nr:GYD domain-containing protein [Nitriliruptorales bacterium]